MSEQTLKVDSLEYAFKVINSKLKVGCRTITKEDALKIAKFINNADFSIRYFGSGDRFISTAGDTYILVLIEGFWLLVNERNGCTRNGLVKYIQAKDLTINYINSFTSWNNLKVTYVE